MAMNQGYRGGQAGRPGGGYGQRDAGPAGPNPALEALLKGIDLQKPAATLFDTDAEKIAKILDGPANKSSQVRRFYDELLRYNARLRGASDEQFANALPFIRMLNARAAYAQQRKSEGATLVDANFVAFLRAMLAQVVDAGTLRMACTLFEAVIGFSPKR